MSKYSEDTTAASPWQLGGESVGNVVETMLALQPSAHSRNIDEGQLLGSKSILPSQQTQLHAVSRYNFELTSTTE